MELLIGVADGLATAHAAGILHRGGGSVTGDPSPCGNCSTASMEGHGALAVAAFVIAASAAKFVLRPRTESASPAKDIGFMQLTDQAGRETFPNLSPDGRSIAYAASGDIYLNQRVPRRRHPTRLLSRWRAHRIFHTF